MAAPQAKSLKCGQCNTLLKDVKAAQAHNDATGHSQFEETTEVVRVPLLTGCVHKA